MKRKFSRMQRSIAAILVTLAMIASPVCGNVTLQSAKVKGLSLYIKTIQYTRTNEDKNVKKAQKIAVKNLLSKQKVSWKSNNKNLAAVKAGKKGEAKLTVSLGKAGTAKITATVRNKRDNRRVKVLTKKITVVNKKIPVEPDPTAVVNPTPTTVPIISPTPEPTNTPSPTLQSPIWVGTWGSSQYSIASSNAEAPALKDSTFRQVVRISTGGEKLRLTFSNEYGQEALEIRSVHIAKPTVNGKSNIDASTDITVTFNGGDESVTIPAKGKVVSDAIDYPTQALEKIAVSTYFGGTPRMLTHHAGSRSNSFLQEGDAVSDETMGTSTFVRWYVLSNIDVLVSPESRSIVCFGDSITDGYGTDAIYLGQSPDRYLRWTDVLADRLQGNQDTKSLSVINMGIGGNSIFGGQGPAAKDRFDRDVLQQEGVRYLVFMIGVNDIGYASDTDTTLAGRMTTEYTKMIEKAQALGIRVFGGTITPFNGNDYYSVRREEIRQEVNDWLRQMYEDGKIDGLIDFDEHLKDPAANPPKILKAYNQDGLHPNPAGYKAMGELVYSAISEDITKFPPTR